MTRGRRKDMTIPPSRALLQQRDYRARKARYVADLEERVRVAEEENVRLKDEVNLLTARLQAIGPPIVHRASPSPEVAAATSELMHNLSAASSSLAHFQRVAFNRLSDPSGSSLQLPPIHTHTPSSLATPAFTPSPLSQSHRRLPSPHPQARIELPPLHSLHRDLFRNDPTPGQVPYHEQPTPISASSSGSGAAVGMGIPAGTAPAYQQRHSPHMQSPHMQAPMMPPARPMQVDPRPSTPIGSSSAGPGSSGYSEEQCCGGFLDCRGLAEEEEDQLVDDAEESGSHGTSSRMSEMRSTSFSGSEASQRSTSSSTPISGPSRIHRISRSH
ncbi:uncharacterized protein LAESUDRAFT_721417 [Laetiporus sulphureus 93-53]|uniref:BZIP domain-containing protein n=1 Tax=Laetiporus sulphureus 93-53 TaxID=1314785 RepID=A0A165GYH6_9APHY|nr:uncharacterized protein LAESUDRAFT_721417 [Laetiporus sulphureus 93-53]KZT11000.1 hypothetical protein LAESUDRAFT_721417 [Laetiporus sulphureus 93-53]